MFFFLLKDYNALNMLIYSIPLKVDTYPRSIQNFIFRIISSDIQLIFYILLIFLFVNNSYIYLSMIDYEPNNCVY